MNRFARLLLVCAISMLAAVVLPAVARADVFAKSASFTYTSQPGDWVGQGQSGRYTTPSYSFNSFATPRAVRIFIGPSRGEGDWWMVDFDAPAGQVLTPGTYTDAGRADLESAGKPGLDVSGIGRGCNDLTGSFTIISITQGPYGYLESLHATFEQNCEGVMPPLRGEIILKNPPAPKALSLRVKVEPKAKMVEGGLIVRGTVECGKATYVVVNGLLEQHTSAGVTTAIVDATPDCKGGHASWSAFLPDDSAAPFEPGPATISLTVSAYDEWYSTYTWDPVYAYASIDTTVTARK